MLTIHLILEIDKIHNLDSKEINFVLLFQQSDLEEYIRMKLTIGFQVDGQIEADLDKQYVMKLNKYIYGIKQGSFNWYDKLNKLFVVRYFYLSAIDQCLYVGNGIIVLTYVDDCIIVGPSMVDIDASVQSMKNRSEKFVLTNEGDIKIPWR